MHDAVRQLALGQRHKTTRHKCPECWAERKNKHDTPLSVTVRHDDTAVFQCHHCGYKGIVRLREDPPPPPKMQPLPPVTPTNPALNYLASRGITSKVALAAGVVYDPERYLDGEKRRAVGFPYRKAPGAEPYACKWRGIDEKLFSQSGAARSLYQVERLREGDNVVICEGEIDALSFWQAGVPAVSVPNGAPQEQVRTSSPMEDKKYLFLLEPVTEAILKKADKVFIATDSDPQGEALGEDLARRIGRGKCWKVLWPDGCKDANATLIRCGRSALHECMEQAQPWPVRGLYVANHFRDAVADLYLKGLVRGQSTGFVDVDRIYTVLPGQLSVVTGIPSMGKSSFIDQVMVNLAKREEWRFAVASFENQPSVHIAKLMQIHQGKPFFEGVTPRMTEFDYDVSIRWVNDHFTFLFQGDGHQASIDDILDRLSSAVLRYGVRGAVIDPANFIDRPKDVSETDWVSETLTKVKVFIMAHDVHLWFIAHPFKLRRGDDGKYAVPGGYDISGSANWFNKADMGLTVHRPDLHTNKAEVHCWKSRFNWVGSVGKADLMYDVPTGSYFDPAKLWQPAPLRSGAK